ncbi:glycerophosphodiester phosphodiesterase family protein [Haloprofundus salilacus]|uniref:glycerophosphodiester phosphodiesterase family protein n=1 Tax=Haloprofundus salilacus TaxID=2876190 RepID=UPI001CCBF2AD|nr:glycerophosphodiester phosphodiesterase family protein [Haloprofundus salilacus]
MDRNRSIEVDRRTFVKGTGAALGTAAVGGVATADGVAKDDEHDEGDATDGDGVEFGEDDDPIEIAHRGFAGRYPENTVAAAVGSGLANADAIEIDVVPCADGEVVVFHDDGLSERDDDGLTDEEGLVWETDCETVLQAEVLESGETVPTLEELMDAIPTELAVNIELKNPGSEDLAFAEDVAGDELERRKELWRPFVENVFDIASNYENEILVSSFYEAALAVTREIDETIPVAFLFWDSIEEGLRVTREYDCEALHPPFDMIQGTPFFNSGAYIEDSDFSDIDLLEIAHEEGREVNVYTVTTWYEAEQLAAAGVDGLIADYPGLLTASDPGRGNDD